MTDSPIILQRVCLEVECGYVHIKYYEKGKHIVPNNLTHDCEQGSSTVFKYER